MTCGFSRDDAEAKFLPLYVREGILPADPFEVGAACFWLPDFVPVNQQGWFDPCGCCSSQHPHFHLVLLARPLLVAQSTPGALS